MILLCLLSVCALVNSASILESSSDLWQNWLLNENEEIPSQQSSPLSRRITPKSVFVAPAFSRCSEGYRLDGMGNCVEIVRLNEAAQWESVLEKLKQMSAQQFGFNKRQSQRNDSSNGNIDGEKINHKVSNNADSTDAAGPFQLSIPFNSKNSSDSQSPQNDTASTTEKPKEISTTFRPMYSTTLRPFFIQSTTIDETVVSQNTHFVDYATEETTDTQESTTFGGVDYPEDTEAGQYANTESAMMETTIVPDSTTEDTITESVVNVASHVAESDFDKLEATTITPHIIKRIPNYHSVVPLKGVVNSNKNVEQVSLAGSPSAPSNPFSNYVSGKPTTIHNSTDVNRAKNPTVHIVNSFSNKNEDVDGESTNLPSDIFQKLPPSSPGERTKPKCDSTNKYDCLLQINIFPTNKPLFLLNRKPSSTAFVRFPETPSKGFVRFPPQKVPIEYDDVALAESNPGYRYWDRRYPSTWWTSWKSKPQFIQIVPETSAIYGVGDMNYIRSHPHFQTQTEWYNK